MSKSAAKKNSDSEEQRFQRRIARQAERKLQAIREEDRGVVFWLGMFGLIGWSIAVPTLAGIALGLWIDRGWPGEVSWTLTLLFTGIIVGCFNAWYWIKQERDHD